MAVPVNGRLRWRYHTSWHERKTRPGQWSFNALQVKLRKGRQLARWYANKRGTTFKWRIRATQYMTKVGKNRYMGRLTGRKTFMGRSVARERG